MTFSQTVIYDMEVVHSAGSGRQWAEVKYCWSGIYGRWLSQLPNGTYVRADHEWINAEDYDFWEGQDLGYHNSTLKKRLKIAEVLSSRESLGLLHLQAGCQEARHD